MSVPTVTLSETDSTNAEAMRRALAGEPPPFWVMAGRQTAGRGRSGRSWRSEPGNLHASLLIRPTCGVAGLACLSLVAGVAVIEAIRRVWDRPSSPPSRLKWPNDILIGDAKVGGILIETSPLGGAGGLVAVIGVGLNLAVIPRAAPNATSLAAHGLAISPSAMSDRLADSMEHWLAVWSEGAGLEDVRAAWLARAGALGEPLAVHAGEGTVTGRFAGLDRDGALLLDDEAGQRRRFTFGDVTLRQSSPAMTSVRT